MKKRPHNRTLQQDPKKVSQQRTQRKDPINGPYRRTIPMATSMEDRDQQAKKQNDGGKV